MVGGGCMEILQIVGLGLMTTFLVLILNQHKSTISILLVVFVSSVIFLFLLDQISYIIQMVMKLAQHAHVNMVYIETLLKIIGITYITEFGAQITKDTGQGSLASKIELGGKIIIIAMAIPILTVVIETVLNLLPKT